MGRSFVCLAATELLEHTAKRRVICLLETAGGPEGVNRGDPFEVWREVDFDRNAAGPVERLSDLHPKTSRRWGRVHKVLVFRCVPRTHTPSVALPRGRAGPQAFRHRPAGTARGPGFHVDVLSSPRAAPRIAAPLAVLCFGHCQPPLADFGTRAQEPDKLRRLKRRSPKGWGGRKADDKGRRDKRGRPRQDHERHGEDEDEKKEGKRQEYGGQDADDQPWRPAALRQPDSATAASVHCPGPILGGLGAAGQQERYRVYAMPVFLASSKPGTALDPG